MTTRAPGDEPFGPGAAVSLTATYRSLAVVTDAGAPLGSWEKYGSGLRADAALIHTLSGVRTVPLSLIARDAAELAEKLHGLPPDVGTIFLTRTNRARTRDAQRLLTGLGGRPLITDDDAVAITLTAAVWNYLIRRRRPLTGSRVLIAGAAALPVISPMLLTAGILDITLWNRRDADQAPLSRVTRDADVVVDLVGPAAGMDQVSLDRPIGSVIGLDQERDHLLALPGLSLALAAAPAPTVNVEVLCACARGLVSATPPHHRLPVLSSPDTTDAVTAAALLVLNGVVAPPASGSAWPSRFRCEERDHPGQR